MWDMVVGTRGQKAACVRQRMPTVARQQRHVAADPTRCHTGMMIPNAIADSEYGVVTGQVY